MADDDHSRTGFYAGRECAGADDVHECDIPNGHNTRHQCVCGALFNATRLTEPPLPPEAAPFLCLTLACGDCPGCKTGRTPTLEDYQRVHPNLVAAYQGVNELRVEAVLASCETVTARTGESGDIVRSGCPTPAFTAEDADTILGWHGYTVSNFGEVEGEQPLVDRLQRIADGTPLTG